jgi:hypothetical protein
MTFRDVMSLFRDYHTVINVVLLLRGPVLT